MSAFALQFLENLWKGFDVDFFFNPWKRQTVRLPTPEIFEQTKETHLMMRVS